MKVLIIAAGVGSRLQHLTENCPKALIKVQGKPILEHQLEVLKELNLKDIVIVIGHKGNQIKDFINNHQEFSKWDITFINNSDPVKQGTSYSVWLAKEKIKNKSYLHLHSDLLFSKELLENLINSKHQNAIILDKQIKLSGRNQRVITNNEKIIGMINDRDLENAEGKAIGIAKIEPETFNHLMNKVEQHFNEGNTKQSYYGLISQEIKDKEFYVVDSKNYKLLEINTLEDLETAEKGLTRNSSNQSSDLQLAIKAIKKAGETILKYYHSQYSTEIKQDKTSVTAVDLASEKIILERLSKTNYPILSEETKNNTKLTNAKTWIVDPLDGTNDFINKTDDFVIMIGLLENKKPKLGVIYQPTTGKLYFAEKGNGAFKITGDIWQRLSVTPNVAPNSVVISKNPLHKKESNFLTTLNLTEIKMRGSIGLKFVLISEAYADFFFNGSNRPKLWDTCAAQAIVEEAGGKVTNMYGGELIYDDKINHEDGILISNGKIHDFLLKKYRNLS